MIDVIIIECILNCTECKVDYEKLYSSLILREENKDSRRYIFYIFKSVIDVIYSKIIQ